MISVPWSRGTWFNPPPEVKNEGENLRVFSAQGSDLWRETSYGFIRDSGHALLIPFPQGSSVEVSFVVDYSGQFDQAGVLVRADPAHWVKAGVEVSEGAPQVGAVVTSLKSDWSLAPVLQWAGRVVTVRVSRSGDALTLRAGVDGQLQLLRVAPIDPQLVWHAGPYCCSPNSGNLQVSFTGFRTGPADASLH